MKDTTIPAASVITSVREHVSCELGGEAVILNMSDGNYYGLNSVGNTVWNFIQEPRRVSEILSVLLREYDVERERCEPDLQELLHDLLQSGLIEVKDAPAGQIL